MLLTACSINQARLPADSIASASSPATQDKTIALLGGTGMAGGYILREALAQGYQVRILSSSPGKLSYLGNRVTVIQGDARDPAVIEQLLTGSDVVVSAIGPRNRQDSADRLNTRVSKLLVQLMPGHGIKRYLVVSGAAVQVPQDHRNWRGWLMRQGIRLGYPALLKDRQEEYVVLATSDLHWTLVRCPLIEAADYENSAIASFAAPTSFHLRAGELARFIIDQIEDGEYLGRGPVLNSH